MDGEAEQITLPETLHDMIQQFFLRTSLPRIWREREAAAEQQSEQTPSENDR